MPRKKTARVFTEEQRAEFLLAFAEEYYLRGWTLETARQRLADCGGDSELAEFEIVAEQDSEESAKARYPTLIFRYPSLYVWSEEERAQYEKETGF